MTTCELLCTLQAGNYAAALTDMTTENEAGEPSPGEWARRTLASFPGQTGVRLS